ncbi:MAG: SDR family oxidoreductase [Bacteroidetes bacterium]|nr:SDR family oxidoreductase [Bacteroidota bacterium]
MEQIFYNQTAIVTGAGMGIGFEIARQLAANGAAVVLNDVDAGRAALATDRIAGEGGRVLCVPGDVSNLNVLQQLVDEAVAHFGRLDIAIANAGITTYGDFFGYPPDSFRQLVAVNLQGSFFLAQFAARQMKKQGTGGRILFMSSVTGHQSFRHLATYGMTKAGLEMLARGLVLELAPHQITVNTIAPGATLTERTLHDPGYAETWKKITPTGRPATVEDIAHAALFLVSPLSGQITGQTLIVDGGWTAVSPQPRDEE